MSNGDPTITKTRAKATLAAPPPDPKQKTRKKKEVAAAEKAKRADVFNQENNKKLNTVVEGKGSQPAKPAGKKTSSNGKAPPPRRVESTTTRKVTHVATIHVGDSRASKANNPDGDTVRVAKAARQRRLKISREKTIMIRIGGPAAQPATARHTRVARPVTTPTTSSPGSPAMSFAAFSNNSARRFGGHAILFANCTPGSSGGTEPTAAYFSGSMIEDNQPVTPQPAPVPTPQGAILCFDVSNVNTGGTITILDAQGRVVKTIHLKPGKQRQLHTLPVPNGTYTVKVKAARTRSAQKRKDAGKPDNEGEDNYDNIQVKVTKVEGEQSTAPAAKK